MDLEDFVEPEIAVTAAVTAAIFSPRARNVMRKGLVYGMAGALTVGDMVTTFGRNVGQGIQQASKEATHAAQETVSQAREVEKKAGKGAKSEAPTAQQRKATTKAETAQSMEGAGGQPV
jgi:hypothetical protein